MSRLYSPQAAANRRHRVSSPRLVACWFCIALLCLMGRSALAAERPGALMKAPSAQASASNDLVNGWNLISIPLAPDSTAIQDVLASIAGRYRIVMRHEGGDVGEWLWYDPADPGGSTLTQLDKGTAFWILMSQPGTLTVTGDEPTTTAQSLVAGWNMVACPIREARPVAQALASIDGTYTAVYGYAAGTAEPWQRYAPSDPDWARDLNEMAPGQGYWVHMDDPRTLYIPYVQTPEERLIQPDDLTYLGAFRLPADGPEEYNWAWSGAALTHNPSGDPGGGGDGAPGSLYGTGHNWHQWVSEVSIPAPINPPAKNVEALNTATTLQPFADIRGDMFGEMELMYAGLAYLPAQGNQTSPKLHFCWGQHYHEEGQDLTHGWCDTDLSSPQSAGGWYLGNESNYATSDYLFEIPATWAGQHTPGKRLATGRYRDGGWSGQGPALFAYGPWNHGNPPATGSRMDDTILLQYTSSGEIGGEDHTIDGYTHADDWSGGSWLTAGTKGAVVFVGTKGYGDYWYGFSNGVVWEEPYPPIPDWPHDDRGWWASSFGAVVAFYDPDDLADVAAGTMEPWEPQPYATLSLDSLLYGSYQTWSKHRVGACAFDRESGLFYLLEPLIDEDRPIVHVWRLSN